MVWKAALILALAAQQPQQFDLDCRSPVPGADASVWKQASIHLRIDLAAMKWCNDYDADFAAKNGLISCGVLHPIVEVQPTVIWLEKAPDTPEGRPRAQYTAIDRVTGEYDEVSDLYGGYAVSAMCQKQPFSGFPKIQTQF